MLVRNVVTFACAILATAAAAAPAGGWLPDASHAAIPSKPLTGRIAGKPFRLDRAELAQGRGGPDFKARTTYFLTLAQGKDFFADQEFWLTLIVPKGKKIDMTRFVLGPEGAFKMPGAIQEGGVTYPPVQGLHVKWKGAGGKPETDMVSPFTVRLEFSERQGGYIPGRIYLTQKDPHKNYVVGTFMAKLTK